MTKYEQNREYVLRGLAIRAAKRNESAARQAAADQEAAQEAAEREMFRDINFRSQWNEIEKKLSQAAERREAEKNRQRHEEQEARRFNDCMTHVYGSLGIAALCCFGFALGAMTGWVAIACTALAAIYGVATFAQYTIQIKDAYGAPSN